MIGKNGGISDISYPYQNGKDDNMKIAIPAASLHMGGGCRVIAETANGLQSMGHEVEVIIGEGKPIDYVLKCKLTLVPGLNATHIPEADIILTNYYTTVLPAYHAFPSKCVRLSLGFEPLWSNDKRGSMDTYLLPMPLISISRWHHDVILEQTGRESTIIHPGIDLSIFHPAPQTKSLNGIKRILFLARDPKLNYSFKGIKDFETAMRLVIQQTKFPIEIQLLCPEGKHQLEGLPAKIFSRGDDSTMAQHYRNCDIFVSASWFESFGYPVLEAMACGALVVTTDSGGVRDFAIDHKTCFMAPPKQPKALAHMIIKALESSQSKIEKIKQQAIIKAKEFTWKRYLVQLEEELQRISQREAIIVRPEFLKNTFVQNYEYGRMMAKMECLPHAIDLPVDVPFPNIIREGIKNFKETNALKTISTQEIEGNIQDSLKNKRGFSLISLGDTECSFLAINRQVIEPFFKIPNEGFVNAGHIPSNYPIERKQMLDAIVRSDMVGIPIFRHGLIQKPLMHFLSKEGIQFDKIHWSDSTVAYQLMATGALKRILTDRSPLVLCIGNEALRLAHYLVDHGVVVSGVISPVDGLKAVSHVIEKASKITYNIALVAAGSASSPICANLARSQQKIAIDIGKVADEWVTGITTFAGIKNYGKIIQQNTFSKHQKSFTLEVQSGYQQGINELVPNDISIPIGSHPHHWIRKQVLDRFNKRAPYQYSIRNPIWLIQKLKETEQNSRPLSVVNVDSLLLSKLHLPEHKSDKDLMKCFNQIDILGIPYFHDYETAKKIVYGHFLIKPRQGWIDTTSMQQLQFDYFGRFLPSWLKNKRLLLIMVSPNPIARTLESWGYKVWGSIDATKGRTQVLSELTSVKKYDVALLSSGVNTPIYGRFISDRMGKISLDIGEMLYDIEQGCINRGLWSGEEKIHKID